WSIHWSALKIAVAIRCGFAGGGGQTDFVMVFLTFAFFGPFRYAPFRVPGYFLAGCFFFAALTGRLLERCFVSAKALVRLSGAVVLGAVVIVAGILMIDTARHNQIEKLTLYDQGEDL